MLKWKVKGRFLQNDKKWWCFSHWQKKTSAGRGFNVYFLIGTFYPWRKRYFSTKFHGKTYCEYRINPSASMSSWSIFIRMQFSRGVRLLNAHTVTLTAFKRSNSTDAEVHYLSLCHCTYFDSKWMPHFTHMKTDTHTHITQSMTSSADSAPATKNCWKVTLAVPLSPAWGNKWMEIGFTWVR